MPSVAAASPRCHNSYLRATRIFTRRLTIRTVVSLSGGIMALRDTWIEKRESEAAAANGNGLSADREAVKNMSQMHLARKGGVTEEMLFVAKREKIEPELVRSEIARGRAIIPANIHHRNLQPMGIGIAFNCKINANIGNSATTSNIEEELKKLHHSVHYGA